MDEYDRLEDLLNHRPIDRAPVVSPLHAGTMALMRAVGVKQSELRSDPHKMVMLAKAAHDMAGFENVTVPFDESVELSAFVGSDGPPTVQRLPTDRARPPLVGDIDLLEVPDPWKCERISSVLKAVELLQNDMAAVPIFLEINSPLMLAMQLRGLPESLMEMHLDPHRMKGLLSKCTGFIRTYVEEASEVGMDQIVLNDPMANRDVLSRTQFLEFAGPHDEAIACEVRRNGIESILHACGRFDDERLEMMFGIDVDAISIDEGLPVRTAKAFAAKGHMVVIGNISTTRTLLVGTVKEVEARTAECIHHGIDAVAPGCHLELFTPLDNLQAMTRTAKNTVRNTGGPKGAFG